MEAPVDNLELEKKSTSHQNKNYELLVKYVKALRVLHFVQVGILIGVVILPNFILPLIISTFTSFNLLLKEVQYLLSDGIFVVEAVVGTIVLFVVKFIQIKWIKRKLSNESFNPKNYLITTGMEFFLFLWFQTTVTYILAGIILLRGGVLWWLTIRK